MAITIFQHGKHGGPGRLGEVLLRYGHRLRVVELWDGAEVPGDLDDVTGVVSLGGTMNVRDAAQIPWMRAEMEYLRRAHEAELPVVGVCLGSQMLATALGGEVTALGEGRTELGFAEVTATYAGTEDIIHTGLPWRMMQFHWHSYQVSAVPAGARVLSGSAMCPVQAWTAGVRTYGFQYHFEATRAAILDWAERHAESRKAAGMTMEELRRQLEAHYEEFARLSTRLSRSIADFLVPAGQRLARV